MKIIQMQLRVIEMDLKTSFVTHLETVKKRRGIIVEITDDEGVKGYGEAVAFSTPWYTEETVQTNYHMIKDISFPLVAGKEISHPSDVHSLLEPIRGNRMAKAAVETAVWDLYSKHKEQPLSFILGGERSEVPAGAVAAGSTITQTVEQIEQLLMSGYERIKVKISPENDIQLLTEIRRQFPEIDLMADANSAYQESSMEHLKQLDSFDLMMIEQPLAPDDIVQHANLQREMKTPICLDESICSIRDAKNAIELGSCQVMNIKIGRVGGLQEAKWIHDLCIVNGIRLWVGGMIEFGISRAHNLALASLKGFDIPGDLSASNKYWEEDIITPEVQVANGKIQLSEYAGIGYSINERRLNEVTIYKEELKLS
ncbi:O-succinylbenzoate synthase [Bacillus ectoiniformans]|uniref:o-succinylbenzoate synthase n=1 Tax=Bacillus ectoiniformans TaxID=1494429 RepID=UPI001957CEE2|nr:o-succinylbenzoate synthase [Bacillus ectoiniformans]MBM7649725.1 O-succinylbenzoate synthase [Bacillus ectoiniformans]